MKEWSIIIVSSECDDKNYKTHKSATQQTINSSNTAWSIKNKFRNELFKKMKTKINFPYERQNEAKQKI